MATEVDDVDQVRAWFGFESIALLDHSWGALLAMENAIRHPERVSHPILMNSAPASRTDVLALRDELARRRSPAQAERMNELRSDPRFQAGDIDTEAEYYRIHYGTTLRNPDHLEAVLRRLRSAFTEDGIRRIADAIPGSRLLVLPHCGHFAYLERPDQTRTSVTACLTTPWPAATALAGRSIRKTSITTAQKHGRRRRICSTERSIRRVSNPMLGTTHSCARHRERDLVDPPVRFEMLR